MITVHRKIFVLCIYALIFASSQVSSDQVPVALWNIKGDTLHLTPASALGKNDKTFKNALEVLNDDAKILVFSVDELSLEDFSARDKFLSENDTIQNVQKFLDDEKHVFLSSVNDPLSLIHEDVHCGVQELAMDGGMDENLLSISLAFDKSCVVILHISDAGVVGPREKMFKPSFKKEYPAIVGIFTGAKSSWVGMSDDHYYSRNLLETELDADPNFVNFTGCLFAYVENATLNMDNRTIILPLPSDYSGSKCGNDSALLQMSFKPSDEKYSSVVVKFNFTNVMGSYSTQVTLEVGDAVTTELNAKDLEAPIDFSYSCGNYVLQNKNMTGPVLVELTFNRFQVQPFRVKDKFSESFDCVTWFTVPIWMGIFVSLILIVIVNVGAYALFSIHTMDRFDDPKGKTITVAAGVD